MDELLKQREQLYLDACPVSKDCCATGVGARSFHCELCRRDGRGRSFKNTKCEVLALLRCTMIVGRKDSAGGLESYKHHPPHKVFRYPGMPKRFVKGMTPSMVVLPADKSDTDSQQCLLTAGVDPVLPACCPDDMQGRSLNLRR